MNAATGHAEAIRRFIASLGAEQVLLGEEDRQFYGQDVHYAGNAPLAVLRPGSVEQLAECVRIARVGVNRRSASKREIGKRAATR